MADAIALVGSESLAGREIREVFGSSQLGERLRLIADGEGEGGKLTAVGSEATFVADLSEHSLDGAQFVILAGRAESAEQALKACPEATFIDLTGALEDHEQARVRGPLAEEEAPDEPRPSIVVVAHPASTAIALLLRRLHSAHTVRQCVAHIFEPASERGKAGLNELQQQTVGMLSFKPLQKEVFGTQLGFALLAKLGEEAEPKLADVEERIEKHLASLLERSGDIPMPSLRLIQAPVFHGHSISLWVEFEDAPSVAELERDLAGDDTDVRGEDVEAPDNVGIAGQSGISVGAITPDRNNASAVWMWLVADNLRLTADNAARLVLELE